LVERRSPKPEVGGSIPSAPANKLDKNMKNPLKFIQDVKQEAFKVTWPTGKETVQGALMVVAMAIVASLFFLLLDQVLKFFLEIVLKVSF
jgi:preprotein translocase subunit SecE